MAALRLDLKPLKGVTRSEELRKACWQTRMGRRIPPNPELGPRQGAVATGLGVNINPDHVKPEQCRGEGRPEKRMEGMGRSPVFPTRVWPTRSKGERRPDTCVTPRRRVYVELLLGDNISHGEDKQASVSDFVSLALFPILLSRSSTI